MMGKTISQNVQEHKIDFAHATMLTAPARLATLELARQFLENVNRYVDQSYLHLDVEKQPERKRGRDLLRMKALLTTDKGRFYAVSNGYGARSAAKQVFSAMGTQIDKRLAR